MGLSTSGNAENVRRAMLVARARGLSTIAMTGESGGKLADIADLLLNVQQQSTHLVQQQHMEIYHQLCILVEEVLFGA
jgi:D-sedoheptulose 7-phosphate isomerase